MVTRPGVNRISIALWVTSIHDGIASGRQFTKMGGGRPAFSSAAIFAACAAAFSFHGGGLVLACASWSLIFGFHTPLQSGSLARSAQSCAVGAGLMTVGAFLGAWAEAIEAARTRATGTAAKIPSGLTFTGSSPAGNASQRSDKLVHCEADLSAKRDHRYPYQQRDGRRGPGSERRLPA